MASVETEIINRSHLKPLTWRRYVDEFFSLWNINIEEIPYYRKLTLVLINVLEINAT